MNVHIVAIGIGLCWALSVGLFVWGAISLATSATYVTLADGRLQERRLPLFFRLMLPFAHRASHVWRVPSLQTHRNALQRKLVISGFDGLIAPEEFIWLRLMIPAFAGSVIVVLVYALLAVIPGRVAALLQTHFPVVAVMLLLLTAIHPGWWLIKACRRRQNEIRRAAPFIMDLLTLSVEAGMDFMSALNRIVDRRKMDAINEELLRVQWEVQVGKTRREALRTMADRLDMPDIRSVLGALIQADEMGIGLGQILRIQSDQMRMYRFERAEKKANEAPVKMLFPLVAFIFPAVFLILLGPILSQIFRLI